ncbi:MAG TPA: FtsX-like permease family protein, partial [Methylomirabilota bacterium]|nr:FtsX-like permease family protein [Methylomirabilota bacterium]
MITATSARPAWTWFFRMAWRDSRRSRRKLLLFSMSIVLGIAAMVAIGSFGRNLESAVEQQTKGLLGADLMVQSRDEFNDKQRAFLDGIGTAQSEQVLFSSMVLFPKGQGTRLAQVGALKGDFPYYGEVETAPAEGWQRFKRGEGALVEDSLMHQFNARVGDEIRIGELTLPIVGSLLKVPGDNELFASFAPRVFLRMEKLQATALLGDSSLARYRRYIRFDSDAALQTAVSQMRDRREELQLRFDTVEERKGDLGESLRNLYRFLNLVGFIALLLGAIGIASAIQVHVRQRLDSVAVLRCLGTTASQAFTIYLIQGAALGLVGVIAGAGLGVLLQQLLPSAFAGFIPIEVKFFVDWLAVLRAAALGFVICMLFALLPLLQVRSVSPLAVFRRDFDHLPKRDPWLFIVYLGIAAGVFWFAIAQTREWRQGVGFAGGLAGALLLLVAVARFVVWAVRRVTRASWPFAWRQGLASLHRPNNRTLLLMVSLGLGTFLILTLYLVQHSLVQQLRPDSRANKPNAVLFDVQADQKEGVIAILTNQNLPVIDTSPVVTMRIQSVKGQLVAEIIKAKGRRDRWPLRREYRSTYRDHLADSEELLSGEWIKSASPTNEIIPISLEQGIATELDVGLGDEIVFDVQGIPLKTRIANLRRVDWRRLQANFFVVFPLGVLDDAPGFFIITTRVKDSEQSAAMQRAVVQRYPNVSTIDFTLVLRVVEGIVSKISFAIRFMAMFTVLTGVILLITAVLNSRFQRMRESILLRTLGASSGQLMRIQFIEFLLLGVLASLTGIILAVAAQWALTKFVFKVGFSVPI